MKSRNNPKTKIAICFSNTQKQHSGSWVNPWVEYCTQNNYYYELIDPQQSDIIEKLKRFDIMLWHFSGFSQFDMLFARSIIYSAKHMGVKVFPDFGEAWHFDDKIAESFLLDAINAPIPKFKTFFSFKAIKNWVANNNEYPLVAKLRNGSGSHNVKLLTNSNDVLNYADKMFNSGYSSTPSLLFKTKSNIVSAKTLQVFWKRFKRIPEFLRVRRQAKAIPKEKGYVYFQEFIPNNGYDLKVVVVGNKLSFIARATRSGDFRASGGGSIFFDRSLVTKDIIDSAFSTSEKLGFTCMGYDYVVDKDTGVGKIVEISYGFSHIALLDAGGYFDRQGNWCNEPLNAPKDVLELLIHS